MEGIKFSGGDIIVRQYKSGREAVCLYVEVNNFRYIIYLGNSFNVDGGLTFLGVYGYTTIDYKYRLSTYNEVSELIFRLEYYIKNFGNYTKCRIDIKTILNIVLKYKNRFRNEKLKRLDFLYNSRL